MLVKYTRNILIFLWLGLCPLIVYGQSQTTKIMGTVIDAATKDPMPFVNVYFAGSGVQTTTDFDGKFSIETKLAKDSLAAQYMGYNTAKKAVVKNKFQYIDFELTAKSFELTEAVILPGENPAEVLLKKVIFNK
ncbi:MAG TPA: carboxypeptidase-like regulatory domain-containing protein, partial [Bacteroidales bacterium]|nr:carboxypeptidase-like regulatory domain-containing protein [Bacteroidales bacterium]